MFIRHLAILSVLAALALASPSHTKKTKSESKKAGPLYTEGCPCYQAEEKASLLALAKGGAFCEFSDFTGSDFREVIIYAEESEGAPFIFLGVVDFTSDSDTDACGFSSSVSLSGSSLAYREELYYTNLDGSFEGTVSDCFKLIEDVKEKMEALGCNITMTSESTQALLESNDEDTTTQALPETKQKDTPLMRKFHHNMRY